MAKSITEAMENKGIGTRLASPDQPYIPKTKPYVHAKDIALKVYGEFADFLMEWQEQRKKPSFLRKKEKPKFSLVEILADIDDRVTEAYRKELQEISGSLPDAIPEESVAGFKEVARKEFLANVARFWPELREQVYELEPSLAPPPAVSREQLSKLRELQGQVDKAVEDMEKALEEIIGCLDQIAEMSKQEHELLKGTQEQGKERFRPLLDELPFAIKTRIGQWQGRLAGMVEKEKPLPSVLRRKW